jgi:hypothetical protein
MSNVVYETTINVTTAPQRRGDVVLQKWVDKNTLPNAGDILVGTGGETDINVTINGVTTTVCVANVTNISAGVANYPLISQGPNLVPSYSLMQGSSLVSRSVDATAKLKFPDRVAPTGSVYQLPLYALDDAEGGGMTIQWGRLKGYESLEDRSVDTAQIANYAVGTSQIVNAAVNAAKIANFAITTEKFATTAIAPKAISSYSSIYASGSANTTLTQIDSQTSSTGSFNFVEDFNMTHSFVLIKLVCTFNTAPQEDWIANVLLPSSADLTASEGVSIPVSSPYSDTSYRLLIKPVSVASGGSSMNIYFQVSNNAYPGRFSNVTSSATLSLWTMSYSG